MGEYGSLYGRLAEKGLRASPQRLMVLEYLCSGEGHPTADDIYRALHERMPSLSKATIYNALYALADAGLAREVNIEEKQARFDATVANHGHFKCSGCGLIYNFPVDMDGLESGGLEGFEISSRDVFFRGTCYRCRDKANEGGK